MAAPFEEAIAATATLVEQAISEVLPERHQQAEAPLWQAMRYGTLGGGKRLRPFLVLSGSALFGVASQQALRAAVAAELVHSYSLIHDDLPAMDNSKLRRGRPTVHCAFNEAIAVLAGDGLLTYAFEVLADSRTHPDSAIRCELILALASAAGPNGMVGGQMLDLVGEKTVFNLDEITRLQMLKTGALFRFSCQVGAILGNASAEDRKTLQMYADSIGLCFQIIDDLLDIEGSEAEVGKSVGRDVDAHKATFVSLLGIEQARVKASQLAEKAVVQLERYGAEADPLREVAIFIVKRHS